MGGWDGGGRRGWGGDVAEREYRLWDQMLLDLKSSTYCSMTLGKSLFFKP